MRCLIVDDDPVLRKLMHVYLKDRFECSLTENGLVAVETFKQAFNENKPFSLVCLDIMMPEMDGHEALKAIRQVERKWGIDQQNLVPVIMTTALSDTRNIETAVKSGCESYLVKPFTKPMLIAEIEKLNLSKTKKGGKFNKFKKMFGQDK